MDSTTNGVYDALLNIKHVLYRVNYSRSSCCGIRDDPVVLQEDKRPLVSNCKHCGVRENTIPILHNKSCSLHYSRQKCDECKLKIEPNLCSNIIIHEYHCSRTIKCDDPVCLTRLDLRIVWHSPDCKYYEK